MTAMTDHKCFSSDVDKQRTFDDTKNMLDACLDQEEMLPYNVHFEQLLRTAEGARKTKRVGIEQ